jgi:hypothetical protein
VSSILIEEIPVGGVWGKGKVGLQGEGFREGRDGGERLVDVVDQEVSSMFLFPDAFSVG